MTTPGSSFGTARGFEQSSATTSTAQTSLQEWHNLPEPRFVVPLEYPSSEPLKVFLDRFANHDVGQANSSNSAKHLSSSKPWSVDRAEVSPGATYDCVPPQDSWFGCKKVAMPQRPTREALKSQSSSQFRRAPGPEPTRYTDVQRQDAPQNLAPPACTPAYRTTKHKPDIEQTAMQIDSTVTSGYSVPLLVRLAERGDQASMLKLLEQGEDPCIKDDIGLTALHAAAKKGNGEIAELLICRRADVNAQATGWQSEAPLHYACKYGHRLLAKNLLAHKADPSLLSKDGRSALQYAQEKKHDKIVSMLMKATN